MRVRYQLYKQSITHWSAECDLTEKQARKRFEELKLSDTCLWAELVGEDDDNYMDILDSFDHTEEVTRIQYANELLSDLRLELGI